MWSYTSKMFLSVYLSKMLIWDNQFLTKQADIFLQIHLIRDIHMKFNGGFCSNSIPGSPDYVLTFSFANQQRYACIMLLQMNTEPGFKMSSKLTENIYLANTYFFFSYFLYPSEQDIFTLTVCASGIPILTTSNMSSKYFLLLRKQNANPKTSTNISL